MGKFLGSTADYSVKNVKNRITWICFDKINVICNKINFIIILLILFKLIYFIFITINTYLSIKNIYHKTYQFYQNQPRESERNGEKCQSVWLVSSNVREIDSPKKDVKEIKRPFVTSC